ncbi:MAG: transglycosylase SLT domain-containing protein, partial [Gammaproteobacteria bacterium]
MTSINTAEATPVKQSEPLLPTASLDNIEYNQFEELYLSSEPTLSIWPRIYAGFQLPSDIDHPSLQTQINWFAKHPEYIQRVMQRADPFLYYILEEAEKRNLPTELVLLPIVESAYQPFAYSHGRAAGIWQFIPSTGRLYGLKQNWWYDGRRDIYASTQAALNYLENLHKLFKGDWMLALAAYNSGSGTVQRAIKRNKKLNRPTDFWNLKLPKETRAYVPKLLALKEVIANPEKYSVSLRCIPNAPGFKQVKTTAQIDLALAAELAEIDLKTLYNYNPAFNRWATDPDGPHSLLLPANSAEIFEKNYLSLPAEKHLRWSRHKIKSGETLSHIALKY